MNRLAINTIIRVSRITPSIRTIVPYRYQSSQTTTTSQARKGSNFTAGLAGGLTVLLGGFAWYHFSGTRQLVNTTQEDVKKAEELKETVKNKEDNSAESLNYIRTTSTTLIPGSAPFLSKVFDQIEEIRNEHADEAKKIVEETYNDFEQLAKDGSLNPQTASKAIEILQKRVKQVQDLATETGADVFNRLYLESAELRDKTSEQYKNLKDYLNKANEKKPEIRKLLKDTSVEFANIFKNGDFGKKNIEKAQKLLKEKADEAKKIVENVKKN